MSRQGRRPPAESIASISVAGSQSLLLPLQSSLGERAMREALAVATAARPDALIGDGARSAARRAPSGDNRVDEDDRSPDSAPCNRLARGVLVPRPGSNHTVVVVSAQRGRIVCLPSSPTRSSADHWHMPRSRTASSTDDGALGSPAPSRLRISALPYPLWLPLHPSSYLHAGAPA